MIWLCFAVITAGSFVCAAVCGNLELMTTAVVDGCMKSVKIALELSGGAVFWCGVMRVLLDGGVLRFLSRVLTPVLSLAFPRAWRSGEGREEITAAICANMLGIGNAATPYALSAMKKMDGDGNEGDMGTFAVLGTCSASIIPTTLITLRRAAGSLEPYSIVVPIWLCSLSCALIGVVLSRIFGRTKA